MRKKKQIAIAKLMFKKSLNEKGFIDPQKLRQAVKETVIAKPAGFINLLKIYKRLIENALSKEEVMVTAASKIPNQKQFEKMILAKTGARKILYQINPKIVFGARVTHGDWTYEATLGAKLKQLTSS